MPRTVWALGLVSLLMDTSSEIIHGLLPVFLVVVLGSTYTTVGLIEGVGEAMVLVLKVFAGPLSDWWGKRKPLVLAGYSLAALSKPLFALAPTVGWVFGAKIFDRVGKGIRGAPRDALIADVVPEDLRGRAFGLRQSLDTVGAVLGPLLAIGLMQAFDGDYRRVFWMAVIPALLCVIVIVAGVQDSPNHGENNSRKKIQFSSVREFKAAFWVVALAGGLSQLARFSESFLILKAHQGGLALSLAPVVLVAMNIVYAVSAYPIGWLSDKMGRTGMVSVGLLILAIADAVLGSAQGLVQIFAGIALWGLHLGFTQGTLAALVADTCPEQFRGTAYGLFNLFSAVALFIASALAGYLWDKQGSQLTFYVSGGLALISLAIFAFCRRIFALDKVPHT